MHSLAFFNSGVACRQEWGDSRTWRLWMESGSEVDGPNTCCTAVSAIQMAQSSISCSGRILDLILYSFLFWAGYFNYVYTYIWFLLVKIPNNNLLTITVEYSSPLGFFISILKHDYISSFLYTTVITVGTNGKHYIHP